MTARTTDNVRELLEQNSAVAIAIATDTAAIVGCAREAGAQPGRPLSWRPANVARGGSH